MTRDKDWQKFEDYVAEELKEIAPYAKPTKGSRYGDLKDVPGLHIECKSYNKINVYKEEWVKKLLEEIPLHSNKIGILVTKNSKNNIRVHLSWVDFLELYKEWYKLKFGENND